MDIEKIAKICHQANKAYCENINDFSQKEWEDAEDWQKESVINGVKYFMDNPNVSPEESHNNWIEKKLIDGWKYGPIKDANKKEHPCILNYSQLPNEQRIKDLLFTSIVRCFK